MKKVNTNEMAAEEYSSPKGKFAQRFKGVSYALGRKGNSTDLRERHPFDVEIQIIPPGKPNCPYHSHSAQWEFYHVISGTGQVRHKDGMTAIGPGDAFLFPPDEPHQLINDGTEDLTLYVIADNPLGESCYYPDSGKWLVRSPESKLVRSEGLDYYEGEE
ncbi:MAG TPA: cupin domain-containing protein [Verrucomicrobiales bacterium]|nr:cupin domain-containing protein [Verrucomicrobiales bacterium]